MSAKSDKVSLALSGYLLKGWRMLADTCPDCDTILLQNIKTDERYCVYCEEIEPQTAKAVEPSRLNSTMSTTTVVPSTSTLLPTTSLRLPTDIHAAVSEALQAVTHAMQRAASVAGDERRSTAEVVENVKLIGQCGEAMAKLMALQSSS